MTSKKDVVCGLGEIGLPILKILSKSTITVGYDINQKLVDEKKIKKFNSCQTELLHVCIPYS
ncbi:MAG: hypothetical protein ACREAE_08325, partial [Nitrosopumilaceae archaeon]